MSAPTPLPSVIFWYRLPAELQNTIIRYTAEPRVIQLALKSDSNGNVGIRGNAPPAALQVDRQWRAELQRIYTLAFGTTNVPPQTWIDFSFDTIYFDESFKSPNPPSGSTILNLLTHLRTIDLNSVHNLAINAFVIDEGESDFGDGDCYSAYILDRFSNIKNFYTIHDDYKNAIVEANLSNQDRAEQLVMVDVWDLDEKFHYLRQWLNNVEEANTGAAPGSINNPYPAPRNEPLDYYKPYKSLFKIRVAGQIQCGVVQPFAFPAFKQKLVVSQAVKDKVQEMEGQCKDLIEYKEKTWAVPWTSWWERRLEPDDDSEASSLDYWDEEVANMIKKIKDDGYEGGGEGNKDRNHWRKVVRQELWSTLRPM